MDLPKLTLTELMLRTDIGDTFYTETKDTVVGSYASRAGIKVATERMLAIHPGKRELIDLTRVTVLEKASDTLERKAKTIEKVVATVRRTRRVE